MKTILALLLAAISLHARELVLTWNANPAGDEVTFYRVYELTGAGWAVIGETESPRFEIGDREPGRYEFAVSAVNFWGESARSDSATTPGGVPSKPGVPRIEGAKRVALEVSEDLETWKAVALVNSVEDRAFFRANILGE